MAAAKSGLLQTPDGRRKAKNVNRSFPPSDVTVLYIVTRSRDSSRTMWYCDSSHVMWYCDSSPTT